MISIKKIFLLSLTFSASVYNSQNATLFESSNEDLQAIEDKLYGTFTAKEPVPRDKWCGSFADLPLLEKRVPSKKLAEPRNVTSATVQCLLSNYKYALLPICSEESIRSRNCICSKTFLYDSFIKNEEKDLYAVTGVDPAIKRVLISYRGTVSSKNWEINYDCKLIQYPGAKKNILVHKGFYEATVALQKQSEKTTLSLLKNPKYKGYKLLITGISLGAAMATVSSLRWKDFLKENNLKNQIEVLAYASPRVGSEGFAQYIADSDYPVTRHTNMNDFFAHLPSRSFGYVHVGAEIYEHKELVGKTKFVYCSQSFDEDPNCGQSQKGSYSIAPHGRISNKSLKAPFC